MVVLFVHHSSPAQSIVVCFYNCENLYDTTNQANVMDEDFLPNSERGYTQLVYDKKSNNIANVIYHLGLLANPNGIALIGLAEIENKMVLTKMLNEPILKKYHYKFIHFDSRDPRGIDVALVYNPIHFTPYQYKPFSLTDETHFNHYATRDILFVKGLLENEWVYILVNHWPSRRGGGHSKEKRYWASAICKKIIDSIQKEDSNAKFLIMGDFNDNPTDKSVKMLQLTNPFMKMYKNGIGSIGFNDSWNLFDQILLSRNWPEHPMKINDKFNLKDYKSIVYSNWNMVELAGKYRGYPKRTYNGTIIRGGYSDHFPVGLIFKLNITKNQQ